MDCPYSPFLTFVFRTPFFSIDERKTFETKFLDVVFKEMINVTSEDLAKELIKKMRNDNIDKKILWSCYRYFQRACTRSTPFGLFAGCSLGNFDNVTNIELVSQKEYKRYTRLDMDCMCKLINHIESDRDIRRLVKYYPNTSLYRLSNSYRYVEYKYCEGKRVNQIVQINYTPYLEKIINVAKKGALIEELSSLLLCENINQTEADEFVYNMIDCQLLVSELNVSVTNLNPLGKLICQLRNLEFGMRDKYINLLTTIEEKLRNIDCDIIKDSSDEYLSIIQNVKKMGIDSKHFFQVDLFKPVKYATLDKNIVNDIQKTIVFLNRITSRFNNVMLENFKIEFHNRYGDKEVPLLNVLDNELGIGYGSIKSKNLSSLIDDFIIPTKENYPNSLLTPIQCVLYRKYQKSREDKSHSIELKDEDVSENNVFWNDLPLTISVLCQILECDDNNRQIYVKYIGGSSAANLLGRFCHLDETIFDHVRRICKKEEDLEPDAIFAEIVHLPEPRIGNVLLRPVLHSYEIPYLANSEISQNSEIRLSDIYVSIKDNKVVLRSKHLNKEIIPRMSSAHNYRNQDSMPIYRFLCDLQHQGVWSLGLQWGDGAQQFDYLPRVYYKNCILSRATWVVKKEEIINWIKIENDCNLLDIVHLWMKKRDIPTEVLFVDNDNELYIDLNNVLSIRSWLIVAKRYNAFRLEEVLFESHKSIIRSVDGIYNNEFVFSFYKELLNSD